MQKLRIKDTKRFLRRYYQILIILNAVFVLLSILYHVGITNAYFGQLMGFLFLIVIFADLSLIVLSDKYLNKNNYGKIGKSTKYLSYIYLLLMSLGIFTFFASQGVVVFPSIYYPVYYALFCLPIVLAILNFRLLQIEEIRSKSDKNRLGIRISKVLLNIFCLLCYFIIFVLAYVLLTGGWGIRILWVVATLLAFLSGLVMIFIPAVTLIFLKINSKRFNRRFQQVLLVISIILIGIFSLPFVSVVNTVISADRQFITHFGSDWNEFDVETSNFFLDTHFVLGEYYLGIPEIDTSNFNVEEDLLFSQGEDYELRYDVFYPKNESLIGDRATIIHMHGGAFTVGDKGQTDMDYLMYLAAQGYVIFDIQYRLLDVNVGEVIMGFEFNSDLRAPDEDVLGNWTVVDMINDIANFTRYLADNNDYNADLSNVYFMGGSAGGYLSAISTLGYNSGDWNFSPFLNISGGLLIYPANNAENFYTSNLFQAGFIPGNKTPDEDPDLYRRLTPSEQADIDDPPCIILHGDRDRLAPYIESVDIQDSMLNEGNICILITGHWGGHGHLESMHHSSVGLYYLERFIYLTKN